MIALVQGDVAVVELNRFNWETVLDLAVAPSQAGFIPSNVHSLAASKFEPCVPLGIQHQNEMVGMLMFCPNSSGIAWINRVMVDAKMQGKGIGKTALQLLLTHIQQMPQVQEVRTSVVNENVAALNLFQSLGFVPLPALEDGETVLRWEA